MPEEEKTPVLITPKSNLFTKAKNWIKLHPRRTLALMGAFLVFTSGGVLALVAQQKVEQKEQAQVLEEEETDLLLLETDPPDLATNVPLDKKFIFRFNQEVDPLTFEHNFSITPVIAGSFKNGESENEIIFTPGKKLPSGANINIQISKNLQSKENFKLVADFVLNFSTDIGEKQVIFGEKDDFNYARLISFSKDREAILNVMVGEALKDVTLNLYRGSVDQLLSAFVYEKKKEGSYDYDQYLDKTVEVYKMKKLSTKSGVKNEDEYKLSQDSGIYYLEAISGEKERVGQVWLTVNSKGLLFRQDDKKIILAGQDLNGKANTTPIQVSFYSLLNGVKILKTDEVTDKKEIDFEFPDRLDLIVGKVGSEDLIVPVSIPETLADIRVGSNLDTKNQLFLYTDRPIYKVGDKVYYRGLLRKDNDALYKLSNQTETIRITATNYSNGKTSTVLDQKVKVGPGGVFSGEFVTNKNFVGVYGMSADVVGEPTTNYSSTFAYFDIADYTKPNFDIEVRTDKSEYKKGEKIQATIIGKQNDGKPLANTEVSYGHTSSPFYEAEKAIFNQNFNINSWGGMCGGFGFREDYYIDSIDEKSPTVKLNSEGKASISLNTSDLKGNESQEVVVVALKKDSSGNKIFGANKVIVRQGDINIFIRGNKTNYFVGDEMSVPFYAETRSGEKLPNKTFNYGISIVRYDPNTYESIEESVLVGSSVTDQNGIGVVNQKLDFSETNYSYYLKVWGDDEGGKTVTSSKYFYLYKADARKSFYNPYNDLSFVNLNVMSEKNSYLVGETASLEVDSPEDLRVLLTLERGRIYKNEWIDLKKGENILPIEITEQLSPSFTVAFTFFRGGRYITEGLALNVPAMQKLLEVEIKSDKEKYLPGEKAKLTITTKNNQGQPVSSRLSLSVVDKAIYSMRKQANLSIHSSFYYFRGRDTNASSSLVKIGDYGGRGGGGGGGLLADKLVDTIYWNPNLQTNSAGTVTVDVQLNSYQTTWRALTYSSTDSTQVGQDSLDFLVSK